MPMSDLHFVIIERDRFIAEDMAQGLRASCPNCAISRLNEMHDAAGRFLSPGNALRT